MKMKVESRITSLLMTMLIVSTFVVAPAMACVPGGSSSVEEINVVEVTGKDKDMLYNFALENEAVKSLKNDLIIQGMEEVNFSAYSKITTFEDGSVFENKIVVIKYGHSEDIIKDIVYVYDSQSGENVVLLAQAENVDLNELKIRDRRKIENNANKINVFELFDITPTKLPSPLLKYDTAGEEKKFEIQSIVENAKVKSDDEIIGMIEYKNKKIVLIDSEDVVNEIVTDMQGKVIDKYQLEPRLVGSTEYIYENSSIPIKTKVDLYQLDIKVPNGKDKVPNGKDKVPNDTVEILTTHIITAQNEAWKEIGCTTCYLTSQDVKVVAKGKFYINYGIEVESVTQQSYKQTNCNVCNSFCQLDRSVSGGSYERQVDATGLWAVNLAPVTAKWEIYSWVSVNKYGTMNSGASEDSWLTPGFGCYSP